MGSNLDNYYNKGSESIDKYNFSLEPLIKDFSFYDFCDNASGDDYGGIIVITNKQYIVGYNSSMGSGSHAATLARVKKDLSGGGYINNNREVNELSRALEDEAFTARILYEPYYDMNENKIKRAGGIVFVLSRCFANKKITYGQYENFLKFYDKYNEEIKYVCKKFQFTVKYAIVDSSGNIQHNECNSLDNVLEYIKNILIEKEEENNNEVILNTSFKKRS